MKKILLLSFALLIAVSSFVLIRGFENKEVISGAPPYGLPEESIPPGLERFPDIVNWKRPDVPLTVGIQVGHWNSDELPEELERIRGNTGASGLGKSEWEVNYEIASLAAKMLEEEGIEVDLLPATVPKGYWADAFISIHADGSEDPYKSGFKVAAPWRDFTGKADQLVALIEEAYQPASGLDIDPNITRNMRGYYAFSWWRFEHAIHPMTPAVIFETGFLTNYSDAIFLIESPEVPATAIRNAVLEFLQTVETEKTS